MLVIISKRFILTPQYQLIVVSVKTNKYMKPRKGGGGGGTSGIEKGEKQNRKKEVHEAGIRKNGRRTDTGIYERDVEIERNVLLKQKA